MPAQSEPQYAILHAPTTGQNALVSGVTGCKIRVHNYVVSAAGTVSLRFFSGTTTALTGTLLGAANGSYSAPYSPVGHFETASGAALYGSLSATQAVSGFLTYSLIGG
jgi:hypothetical protein